MRNTLILIGLTVVTSARGQALAGAAPAPAPAPAVASDPMSRQEIAPGLWVVMGKGGNIGVCAGEDGLLLVDDKFADTVEAVRTLLGDLPGAGKPAFVLNTHWHGDHTGGNPAFGKDGVIIAHENVRARLSTVQVRRGKEQPAMAKEGWPVVTYGVAVTVHFNGEDIAVWHPGPQGHTDGDAVVWFPAARVLHTGDLWFNGRFPLVDQDAGGSVDGYLACVDAVLAKYGDASVVIPGHGEVGSAADYRRWRGLLGESVAAIRKELAEGRSQEQIVKSGPVGEFAALDGGFISWERWVEYVVRDSGKAAGK